MLPSNLFYNQLQIIITTVNTNDGARSDISARSFRITGQKVIFDFRAFDPNASRYQSRSLEQCFAVNEREKKWRYIRKILEVEHVSFTLLIFTIHVAMGIKYSTFVSKLIEPLPKFIENKRYVWVRTKVISALIRSMLICLRGSHSIKSSTMAINDIYVQRNVTKNQREHQIKHLDNLFLDIRKMKIMYICEFSFVICYYSACSEVIKSWKKEFVWVTADGRASLVIMQFRPRKYRAVFGDKQWGGVWHEL